MYQSCTYGTVGPNLVRHWNSILWAWWNDDTEPKKKKKLSSEDLSSPSIIIVGAFDSTTHERKSAPLSLHVTLPVIVTNIMSSTVAEVCSAATGMVPTLSSSPVGTVFVLILLAYLLNDKYNIMYHFKLWMEYTVTHRSIPIMDIEMTPEESSDEGVKGEPVQKMELMDPKNPSFLNCYDPSTRQFLGQVPNMTTKDVHELLVKAKIAQESWSKTTFVQRRMVLRTIQQYIVQHVQDICRVSSRESGKPKVDAMLGEILTTCEKIRTICEMGELWLQPNYRTTGPMMVHKNAWVEYVPLGIIAPIAPWNYPFHNSVRLFSFLGLSFP